MRPAVLILIPARGGSKGIPRKNLRALAGRPLIAYSISTALGSRHRPEVVVTSEDVEIVSVAEKLGARILRRDPALADDATTVDEVITHAYEALISSGLGPYDVVVTIQPTSPLLTSATVDAAIDAFFADPELDTLLSAVESRHLTWSKRDGRYVPTYPERVNRQYLEPVYRETGGLVLCRPTILATGTRIGRRVTLLPLSGGEAVDIDTREDWALCEWYLAHRDVLFVVAGDPEVGLGHTYNALTIANELVRHRVRFLVTRSSELAEKVISAGHYEVHRQQADDLVDDIVGLGPDVVVNDRLDTDAGEIRRLKAGGLTVVNFEDLGSGAREADLVVNAIYPERETLANHYFGARFFCLRSDFALTEPRPTSSDVRRALISFGGVDPNNLTRRTLLGIEQVCRQRGIALEVVLGRGYRDPSSLAEFQWATIEESVVDMADRLRRADIAVTSAGRTIFEIACLGTPALVMAQNQRELTHLFASEENGFVNLGLGMTLGVERIRDAFTALVDDAPRRREMQNRMLGHDLRSGTARVVRLMESVLENHGPR